MYSSPTSAPHVSLDKPGDIFFSTAEMIGLKSSLSSSDKEVNILL